MGTEVFMLSKFQLQTEWIEINGDFRMLSTAPRSIKTAHLIAQKFQRIELWLWFQLLWMFDVRGAIHAHTHSNANVNKIEINVEFRLTQHPAATQWNVELSHAYQTIIQMYTFSWMKT